MKNKILDYIINIIKKYYNYNDLKLKEIRYGLESIYLSIFKIIVIFIISYFIHAIKELCIFLLFYYPIRITGFGLHTKKSIHCWIASLTTFTLIPYLIKTMIIQKNIIISIIVLLIVLIIMYAPADTEKRPLINPKKRIIYKILTLFISVVYLLIIIFTKNNYLINVLLFAVLLETLLILPISYKLFGLKYANYKRYIRKEVKKWDYLLKLLHY